MHKDHETVQARRKVYDLLPAPFDWIAVPAGPVTLHNLWDKDINWKTQDHTVGAFAIARYPITNAQYQVFVGAKDGYVNAHWWDYSADAKQWRGKNQTPKDTAFPGDNVPRTNVTWYEALAFCRWLSAATGEEIMLPTEQQWQRAAQALPDGRDSGYAYPWGQEWDATASNNNVGRKGVGKTTPVTQYEGKGDSPLGVVDMSGNVWEWCATHYHSGRAELDGTDVRVLRGGSWNVNYAGGFRVAYRDGYGPDHAGNYWGFRLSRSL